VGYTFIAASRPTQAIFLARDDAGVIGFLVTDLMIPEMNCRDLAGSQQTFFPQTKRLFVSGYTADIIVHHWVLNEGVCFLQKPFSRQTFAAKVREALAWD
jgi:FixJ family two-component response regulator